MPHDAVLQVRQACRRVDQPDAARSKLIQRRRHRIDREVSRPQVVLDRAGQRHEIEVHVVCRQQYPDAAALGVEREVVAVEHFRNVRPYPQRIGLDCYVEVLDLPSEQNIAQEPARRPGIDPFDGEDGRQL